MGSDRFDGKKILVFGASSGIGRQTAVELGVRGAKVVLVGRNEARLQETADSLTPGRREILLCDVSDFERAQNAVKDAVKLDGQKLDGCVFSAGIAPLCPVSAVREDALLFAFQTNFFSMAAILKAFASRRVSNDNASFVSVASRAATMPDKGQGVYGATKAAICAYTVAAAKELSARGIRVNALCPEVVDTPMAAGLKAGMPPERLRRLYPLGMLTAGDVADYALYLLSDCSRRITGQSLWLSAGNDGGSIEGYNDLI